MTLPVEMAARLGVALQRIFWNRKFTINFSLCGDLKQRSNKLRLTHRIITG